MEPKSLTRRAIIMFEDKNPQGHKEITAALAGHHFPTLQEAINKAQVVEEKPLWRDSKPSNAFLKGLEPNSKLQSFKASIDLGKSDDTITTSLKAKSKRGLEETTRDLKVV